MVGFGVNLASAPAAAGPRSRRHSAARSRRRPSRRCSPAASPGCSTLWRSSETVGARSRLAGSARILPGTRLTVHVGKDETLSGRFAGLEPDGALRLQLDDGSIEVVRAGDVFLS